MEGDRILDQGRIEERVITVEALARERERDSSPQIYSKLPKWDLTYTLHESTVIPLL